MKGLYFKQHITAPEWRKNGRSSRKFLLKKIKCRPVEQLFLIVDGC
jgi:hypothetical protein